MTRGLLSLAALVAACSGVDNPPVDDPSVGLDESVFRCSVEPILVRQCSYNACHGTALAALRVYSPGKLREKVPATLDAQTAVLTESEHHANFLAAAGFSFGTASVDDNFLLRKPLPAAVGGFEHKGGAIYTGIKDDQYKAVRAWLGNSGACP